MSISYRGPQESVLHVNFAVSKGSPPPTKILYDTLIYMYITFLRKSDCLGCAVLLCLVVCLTLLASFVLPSHLSLKHV